MTGIVCPAADTYNKVTRASNWVIAILLAIVLEGALRKWVLSPFLHPVAYFSKDILALGFVLNFGLPAGFKALDRLRDQVFLVTCLLVPSFLLGLTWSVNAAVMTFKNAVLWPLFAIYMAGWFDWTSLTRITRMLAFLCMGMAVLGLVQFSSPSAAPINRYAWHVMGRMERVATFGTSSGVRATGTFSYITGYAEFASVSFLWMVWRFLNSRTVADRCLCAGGAVSSVVCILTSGSRAPLYQCALGLVAAVIVSSHIRHKIRVLTLCVIGLVFYLTVLDKQLVNSFYGRFTTAGDSTAGRIAGAGLDFVQLMLDNPFGIGMGQQSNVKDYRIAEQTTSIEFIEDGRSRLAIEGGVLAVLAQAVTFLLYLRITSLSLRTGYDQSRIAAAAILPAGLYLLTNSLWYDHNASALWWFLIGAWLAITLRITGFPVRNQAAGYGAARVCEPQTGLV